MIIKKSILFTMLSFSFLAGCASSYQPIPDKYITDERYEKPFKFDMQLEKNRYNKACKGDLKEYDCAKRKAELDKKMENVAIPFVKRLNELNPELLFKYNKETYKISWEWRDPEKHKMSVKDMLIVDKQD